MCRYGNDLYKDSNAKMESKICQAHAFPKNWVLVKVTTLSRAAYEVLKSVAELQIFFKIGGPG